jgi:nicotinamide mononucleotide transporter
MTVIQLLMFALGAIEVFLARANNVWLYPAGIASILLGMYTMVAVDLYAEFLLNSYYLVMSIYGWIHWTTRRDERGINVTFSSKTEWMIALAISFGGGLLFYLLLGLTPSNTRIWDAWVSATGCAGMWLLARRKVENWILLNVSNVFNIPLLVYKGLNISAAFIGFLFIVACFGYFDWRKIAYARR